MAAKKKAKKPRPAKKAKPDSRHTVLDRLDAVLSALGDDFRVFSSKNAPPSAADSAAAEAEIGRRFPPEYRAFVARWGSIIIDVKPEIWPPPAQFEVRPAWQMDFGRAVFGVGPGPQWMRVAMQFEE